MLDNIIGTFLGVFMLVAIMFIFNLIKSLFKKKIIVDIDGVKNMMDSFFEYQICGYSFKLKHKGRVLYLFTSAHIKELDLLRLLYSLKNNGIVVIYLTKEGRENECIACYFNGKVRLLKKNLTIEISNDKTCEYNDLPVVMGMIVLFRGKRMEVNRFYTDTRFGCIDLTEGCENRGDYMGTIDEVTPTFNWVKNEEITPYVIKELGLNDNGIGLK